MVEIYKVANCAGLKEKLQEVIGEDIESTSSSSITTMKFTVNTVKYEVQIPTTDLKFLTLTVDKDANDTIKFMCISVTNNASLTNNTALEYANISFIYIKNQDKVLEIIGSYTSSTENCIYGAYNIEYLSGVVPDIETEVQLMPAYRKKTKLDGVYVCPYGLFTAGNTYTDGTNTFVSIGSSFFYKTA